MRKLFVQQVLIYLSALLVCCCCIPSLAAADLPGDAHDYGLPSYWLVFGFIAQAIFMARMVVQWLVSERKKESVMPVAFWWLSLVGGCMLCIYFLRRGDPVGISGQMFGIIVYTRNLVLIHKRRRLEV